MHIFAIHPPYYCFFQTLQSPTLIPWMVAQHLEPQESTNNRKENNKKGAKGGSTTKEKASLCHKWRRRSEEGGGGERGMTTKENEPHLHKWWRRRRGGGGGGTITKEKKNHLHKWYTITATKEVEKAWHTIICSEGFDPCLWKLHSWESCTTKAYKQDYVYRKWRPHWNYFWTNTCRLHLWQDLTTALLLCKELCSCCKI